MSAGSSALRSSLPPTTSPAPWRAGTNVIWSPVAGLDLGVEVLYANIDTSAPEPIGVNNNIWEGRLRVQRDF